MENVQTFKISPSSPQAFHDRRKGKVKPAPEISIAIMELNPQTLDESVAIRSKDAGGGGKLNRCRSSTLSPRTRLPRPVRKTKLLASTAVKRKNGILKTSSLGNLTISEEASRSPTPKPDKTSMKGSLSSSSLSSKGATSTKVKFKRMNSSPSVVTKSLDANAKKANGSNKVKMVRIDEDVQVRHIETGTKKTSVTKTTISVPKATLVRSNSFEGRLKTGRQKNLDNFYPRRRFSHSATESIKELFEEIEKKARKRKEIFKSKSEREEAAENLLSREDRLDMLEDQSSFYYEDDCLDWVALKSLTGKNASGWKFQDNFYGVINEGKRRTRPSMDTAWGRRIYDQYEIELESKPRSKYLTDLGPLRQPRELGLWDLIFDPDIIPQLECSQRWDPLREEKMREMRRLKIDPARLEEDLVISEDVDDPLNRFKMKFMRTGEYLRPHDMRFCVERTNFTEEQIITWFRRFRRDCPDGRLTKDSLRTLFRMTFPDGNAEKFSNHIMRIFDSDGNDFLDFKEFLVAMDISTCETEESKLEWAFKLYDFDNNGCIEVHEMIRVMETLESLECTHQRKRKISYDEFGNLVRIPTPEERARDLFAALDRDGVGYLTVEKFVQGYMERNELLARQDAQEQKRNLDSLILKGPAIPDPPAPRSINALPPFNEQRPSPPTASLPPTTPATLPRTKRQSVADAIIELQLKTMVCALLCKRAGVDLTPDDLDIVSIRPADEDTPTRSVFVRFASGETRMRVWAGRGFARRAGLYMEEHLTPQRQKIWGKCAALKAQGKLKELWTKNGDIFVQVEAGGFSKQLVVTDSQFDNLLKVTKGVGGVVGVGVGVPIAEDAAEAEAAKSVESNNAEERIVQSPLKIVLQSPLM